MRLELREEKRWFERALTALRSAGSAGRSAADYIERHQVPLGFTRQKGTGASWFDWRRLRHGIFLNADYVSRRPDDAFLCSLLAHEAKHLEQGLVGALSVRGELVAWQLQYDVLAHFSAEPTDDIWRQIRVLEPSSRGDLKQARQLMKQSAGPGYHIDWLPPLPLPEELLYQIRRLWRRLSRFSRERTSDIRTD